MLQKLNITKRQLILTALLIATFMLPFVANISTADALGNYECFTQNRKQHVSCLRAKLDSTPHGLTVPKARDGMGIYGCFDRDRRTHVTCLRSLLDEHGPHLAEGAAEPVPPMDDPETNPPTADPVVEPHGVDATPPPEPCIPRSFNELAVCYECENYKMSSGAPAKRCLNWIPTGADNTCMGDPDCKAQIAREEAGEAQVGLIATCNAADDPFDGRKELNRHGLTTKGTYDRCLRHNSDWACKDWCRHVLSERGIQW